MEGSKPSARPKVLGHNLPVTHTLALEPVYGGNNSKPRIPRGKDLQRLRTPTTVLSRYCPYLGHRSRHGVSKKKNTRRT